MSGNANVSGNAAGGAGGAGSKDKESNVKVVVRCRGRNEREVRDCLPTLLQAQGPHTLVVRPSLTDTNISRVYTFDSVYGPEASQQRIFDDVIKPMLDEVQQGYNCSIFCYGQTGTGKTYTMEGDLESAEFAPNANAGIIPRALHHMFTVLESNAVEFSVRASYLELYNEELKDLLAPSEDDQRKLRIFEDGRKGNFVQGLEERLINNVVEGITILKKGSLKRQTAATKCNDKSSRSHAIFSITVHTKETTPDNEDLLSIGKLNFVDLAGSENIGRSGAENKRAREAGMINQSLLVLGRVINALVEKSPHVPYRESKLTRLLQDSLGGRTKTTMIATVGPTKCSMDETLSTLEYANRAKSIRNKPEVNQRMTKNELIGEYTAKIDRLAAELKSTREKNGIYMAPEAHQAMMDENRLLKDLAKEQQQQGQLMADHAREVEDENRSLKDLVKELRQQGQLTADRARETEDENRSLKVLAKELRQQGQLTADRARETEDENRSLKDLVKELRQQGQLTADCARKTEDENRSLKDLVKELRQQGQLTADRARETEDHLQCQLEKMELLIRAQSSTESRLDAVAKGLVVKLDESTADVTGLHAKLERQEIADRSNLEAHNAFREDLLVSAAGVEGSVEEFLGENRDVTASLARCAQSQLSRMAEVVEAISRRHVEKSLDEFSRRVESAKEVIRKRRRLSGKRDSEIKAICDKFDKNLKEHQEDYRMVHALAVQQLGKSLIAQGAMLGNRISEMSAKQEKIRREVTHQISEQKKAFEDLAERVRLDAVEGAGRANEATQNLETFAELERRQDEDDRQEMKDRFEALLTELAESRSRRRDSRFAAAAGRSRECESTIKASAQQYAGLLQEKFGRLNESSQNIAASVEDAAQDVVDTKLRITESSQQIDHDVQNFSGIAADSVAGMGRSASGICQSVCEILSQSETSNVDAETEHLVIMDELMVVVRDESETLSSSLQSVGSDATAFENTVADSLAKNAMVAEKFRSTATNHVASIRSTANRRDFLCRDPSTGITPPRKEYQYPRSWPLTDTAGAALALARESGGNGPPPNLDEGGSATEHTAVVADIDVEAGGITSATEKGEPAPCRNRRKRDAGGSVTEHTIVGAGVNAEAGRVTPATEKGEPAPCRNRRKRDGGGSVTEYAIVGADINAEAGRVASATEKGEPAPCRNRRKRADDEDVGARKRLRPARAEDKENKEMDDEEVAGGPFVEVEVPAVNAETDAVPPRRKAKAPRSLSQLPRRSRIPTQPGRRGKQNN